MTGNTKQHTEHGFTLVEVLVATTVMSIVMVLAANLLLIFFRSQGASRDTLSLEGEARQILSRIVESSRNGFVDYDFYTAEPNAEPEFLALTSLEGEATIFWFYTGATETNIYLCTDTAFEEECDKTVDPETGNDWEQINTDGTTFVLGRFTITPDTPPYFNSTGGPLSDEAPTIRISMQLQLENSNSLSSVIQTIVTSRIYAR